MNGPCTTLIAFRLGPPFITAAGGMPAADIAAALTPIQHQSALTPRSSFTAACTRHVVSLVSEVSDHLNKEVINSEIASRQVV